MSGAIPLRFSKFVLFFVLSMNIQLSANAAEPVCQTFRVLGQEIQFNGDFAGISNGHLSSIVRELEDELLIEFNFSENQACLADNSGLDASTAAAFVINTQIDELAVRASIDASVDVWLRIDLSYSEELILDRTVAEEIGLTDMEFLSDNSGVGAEDFFAEQVGFLVLGSSELDAPFAEVPRFGVEYNHYSPEDAANLGSGTETQGSVGLASLKMLSFTIDPSNSLIYFSP